MHVDAVETARMAIYLNAVVAGHSIAKFWGDGARFVSAPGGPIVGRDPPEWLATIVSCRGLNVAMRSSKLHLAANAIDFGRGLNVAMRSGVRYPQLPIYQQASHWVLKVHSADGAAAWRPSYEIRDEPGLGRRLWLVSYCPEEGDDAPIPRRDLAETTKQLSAVLKGLITLTGERIPAWQDKFIGLLATLEGREPTHLDPALPRDVLADLPNRLVGTAFAAQVFRGMGNWGDYFDNDEIYQAEGERLNSNLYSLLAEALVGAVDTTMPHRC